MKTLTSKTAKTNGLTDNQLKTVLGVSNKADMLLLAEEQGYNWDKDIKRWTNGKEVVIASGSTTKEREAIKVKTVKPAKVKKADKPAEQGKTLHEILELKPEPKGEVKVVVLDDFKVAELINNRLLTVKKTGAKIVDADLVLEKGTNKPCYKFTADNGKVHNWYPELIERYALIGEAAKQETK